MIKLIVVDAGHTLGTFDRPGTRDLLAPLSPLPGHVIQEEGRRWLHCAPELTEDVIMGMCNALLIDPEKWPRPWPETGFTIYPYAVDSLARLREVAPIVVLSNLPVMGGQQRMSDLVRKCYPYISGIYTSFRCGMRKPDRRLWQLIAADHGIAPEEMVHLGDQWGNDVLGSVWAGCRAVYVNTRDREVPTSSRWPVDRHRIVVVGSLREAVEPVRHWHETEENPVHLQRPFE